MIVSFRDRRTRDFAAGRRVRSLFGIERTGAVKLTQLEAATSLGDLTRPGNRQERLRGDRAGQWSIRINDQWRIYFEWPAESRGPVNVEIADYH